MLRSAMAHRHDRCVFPLHSSLENVAKDNDLDKKKGHQGSDIGSVSRYDDSEMGDRSAFGQQKMNEK